MYSLTAFRLLTLDPAFRSAFSNHRAWPIGDRKKTLEEQTGNANGSLRNLRQLNEYNAIFEMGHDHKIKQSMQ